MKRKELLESLDIVKSCITDSPIIEILSNVLFNNNQIASFNGEQGIIVNYDSPFSFIVKGKLLINLLRSYNIDDISIIQNTEDITIKANKSINKILIDVASKFPFTYDTTNLRQVATLTDKFIDGISKCLVSTDKNSIRKEQACVVVTAKKDANIVLYATKYNYVISKYVTDVIASEDINILFPYRFCENIISLFKDKNASFGVADKSLLVSYNDIALYSVYDAKAKISDFETELSSFDLNNITTAKITDEFKNTLNRSKIILSDEKNKNIKINIEDKLIRINGESALSSIEEEIELDNSLNVDTKFTMNSELLDEAINNSDRVGVIASENGIILVGKKDEDYTILVQSEE